MTSGGKLEKKCCPQFYYAKMGLLHDAFILRRLYIRMYIIKFLAYPKLKCPISYALIIDCSAKVLFIYLLYLV